MILDSLNPFQKTVFEEIILNKKKIIGIQGGWGCGKSALLVHILNYFTYLVPNGSSLLVTDTNTRWKSVLSPEIEKWFGDNWIYNGGQNTWTNPKTNHVIWCRSYFRFGTRSSGHNPLEGLNLSGVALIDECQTFDDSEVAQKALGRLRGSKDPTLIMTGLPMIKSWWVELAKTAGESGVCLFPTSFENKKNLSEIWFNTIKSTLPPDEYEAMILNRPKPPKGLVYSEFDQSNIIDNWKYDQTMKGRIAIDWGFRYPAVLFIINDNGQDIIVDEICIKDVTLRDLSREILKRSIHRSLVTNQDQGKWVLDSGVGDKAGRSTSDHSGSNAFRELAKGLEAGGIGFRLTSTTDKLRTHVLTGVQKLKRAFYNNKYLVTKEFWIKSEKREYGLYRAMNSYKWNDKKDEPIKDGLEHMLDALRYDCIKHHWTDRRTFKRSPIKKEDIFKGPSISNLPF